MDSFKWILELVDRVSKPARDAEKATGGFEKELKKVEAQIARIKAHPVEFKQLKSAQKELRELSGGSKSFASRFEEMGQAVRRVGFVQNVMLGVEALKVGVEVGEKLVDVVYDIGKEMVGAAGKSERFKMSFNSLLGAEGAEDVLSYIEQIEKHTELSGSELKSLSANFLAVGFNAKQLSQILPAALDIGAFRGGGIANVQAAAEALEHIKTTGEISKRSLGALGLEWTKVMTELRKETGLNPDALKKKMDGGKFGDQVLHAVLKSTADKQAGKRLGGAAEDMANSVDAKLKKIRELPEKLFEKWAETPAFDKFSKSLTKILDKLDPAGPNGKKLFGALNQASEKVVKLVDEFASGDGIDRFTASIVKVAKEIDKVPKVLNEVVEVSEILATVWAGSKIVGAVTSLTALMPGLATASGTAIAAIGTMAAPLLAVAAAAGSVYYAIHRVSETAKELGGWDRVNKDFKDWLSGEQPAVANSFVNEFSPDWKKRKATGNPLPTDAMPAQQPAEQPAIPSQSSRVQRGGARVDQAVHIETHVHVDGSNANADEIANKVNQSLPGSIQQSMERLAISSGSM